MDLIELALVGWLFAVGCGIVLLLGTGLTVSVYASGEEGKRALKDRLLDDFLLFTIWLAGMTGGIGVLLEKSWSRWVLELFCWVLIVLACMSAYGRWRAMPPPRGLLPVSLALFIMPVIALCIGTILSLRGETALRVLVG